MSNFLEGGTVEDALGAQAGAQVGQIKDQYAKARKKQVAVLGANGNLNSGVATYPLTDLATNAAGQESDVYSNLANTLGQIPAEDINDQNSYNRNLQLARLIAEQNKPSALQEALGAVGTATHIFCGGYVENECKVIDKKTGEVGVMAESGPELIIRLDTLGLTKKDIETFGLKGKFIGFDEAGISDEKIRDLVRLGLTRIDSTKEAA